MKKALAHITALCMLLGVGAPVIGAENSSDLENGISVQQVLEKFSTLESSSELIPSGVQLYHEYNYHSDNLQATITTDDGDLATYVSVILFDDAEYAWRTLLDAADGWLLSDDAICYDLHDYSEKTLSEIKESAADADGVMFNYNGLFFAASYSNLQFGDLGAVTNSDEILSVADYLEGSDLPSWIGSQMQSYFYDEEITVTNNEDSLLITVQVTDSIFSEIDWDDLMYSAESNMVPSLYRDMKGKGVEIAYVACTLLDVEGEEMGMAIAPEGAEIQEAGAAGAVLRAAKDGYIEDVSLEALLQIVRAEYPDLSDRIQRSYHSYQYSCDGFYLSVLTNGEDRVRELSFYVTAKTETPRQEILDFAKNVMGWTDETPVSTDAEKMTFADLYDLIEEEWYIYFYIDDMIIEASEEHLYIETSDDYKEETISLQEFYDEVNLAEVLGVTDDIPFSAEIVDERLLITLQYMDVSDDVIANFDDDSKEIWSLEAYYTADSVYSKLNRSGVENPVATVILLSSDGNEFASATYPEEE